MLVRKATVADSEAAVELLRACITQLCAADHQNDPASLERWLQNKTVAHLERWISDERNFVAVATLAGELAGIGLITSKGDIYLCYVRPGHTGAGIGGAILQRLEAQARGWGLTEIRLSSTIRARPFYERHGYVSAGAPAVAFGVVSEYPYRKQLASSAGA